MYQSYVPNYQHVLAISLRKTKHHQLIKFAMQLTYLQVQSEEGTNWSQDCNSPDDNIGTVIQYEVASH